MRNQSSVNLIINGAAILSLAWAVSCGSQTGDLKGPGVKPGAGKAVETTKTQTGDGNDNQAAASNTSTVAQNTATRRPSPTSNGIEDDYMPRTDQGTKKPTDGTASDDAVVDSGAQPTPVPTFNIVQLPPDIKQIMTTSCGGGNCHNASFGSYYDLKSARAVVLQRINNGSMPRGMPGWANSADGQKAIQYIMNDANFTQ